MADLSGELFGVQEPKKSRGDELAAELFGAPKEQSNWDKLSVGLSDAYNTLRGDPMAALRMKENVGNLAAGGVRGAGSIGNTLLAAGDAFSNLTNPFANQNIIQNYKDRAQGMNEGLQSMGANTDSMMFKTGKIGGEVAGTAGVGGMLANGARLLGASAPVVASLGSGGFNLAGGTGSTLGNIAARAGGGAVTGGATSALINPEDAGYGALIGAGLPFLGQAGGFVADQLQGGAKRLMRSALKPSMKANANGDAELAVQTMLDNGINVSKGGVAKLQNMIGNLNDEISQKIGNSNATINKEDILNSLAGIKGKFGMQVNPKNDLNTIDNVYNEFSNHPYFQAIEEKGGSLKDELNRAQLGKIQALQAAGKLKTFAAQQKNLAEGDYLKLSSNQPENQLYFNTGNNAGTASSPSAYPVSFMPRFPSKYTNNIDRVQEGLSGSEDAMAAYVARKKDAELAQNALNEWDASRNMMPVQIAQKMKQGTYRVLNGKFGEIGSADTEAQKGLARGLKEGIADAVPDIAGLNAQESALIKTLDVNERRVLQQMNNNPVGIAGLAKNPAAVAGMMLDKSALFKSLAARMLNNSGNIVQSGSGLLSYPLENPLLRTGLLQAYNQNN